MGKAAVNGKCTLCDEPNQDIQNSHIIPEWCYKSTYASDHTIQPVSITGEKIYDIEQKGFREYLLCKKCEVTLSKWENELSKVIRGLSSNPITYVTSSIEPVSGVEFVSKLDYGPVKLAILSIYWRMSIASHRFFSNYQLGPYEVALKNMLKNSNPSTGDIFPITISRFKLNGEFLSGMMSMMTRGSYANKISMQPVLLCGYVVTLYMNDGKHIIPTGLSLTSLRQDGRFISVPSNKEDINLDENRLYARMKEPHVEKYYIKRKE